MEKIKTNHRTHKHENALKAYKALEKSIRVLKKSATEYQKDEHDVIVAGVIKHFELSLESTWKFLQFVLDTKYNETLKHPRDIIRKCYEVTLLPQEVTDKLLNLYTYRNNTVHVYDQSQADEFCREIEEHYKAIGKVFKLLTPDMM